MDELFLWSLEVGEREIIIRQLVKFIWILFKDEGVKKALYRTFLYAVLEALFDEIFPLKSFRQYFKCFLWV